MSMVRLGARLGLSAERVLSQSRFISQTRVLAVDRKYTKKHEWVVVDNDVATVGISDFAADQLGDVVFVELPEPGTEIAKGESTGAVESVKAASDIYAPLSGTVTEVNSKLEDESGTINKSPFGEGWIYKLKVKDASELASLMSQTDYDEFKKADEGH